MRISDCGMKSGRGEGRTGRRGERICVVKRLPVLIIRNPKSAFRNRLAFAQEVRARVGVIGLPVEPVVLERGDFQQSLARERARRGRAVEVPLASGLRVEEGGRFGLEEEFERATVEAAVEDAHAL